MPNTDLTETTANNSAVPEEPKKSNAASRILRAVEKSRGDTTARLQIPAPVAPAATTTTTPEPAAQTTSEPLPKLVMPKIGIDAREALRSLSERGASERLANETTSKERPASEEEPAPPPVTPLQSRTVSDILRETKPAETAPLPGESKPSAPKSAEVRPSEPKQGEVRPSEPKQGEVRPSEPKQGEAKQNGSKSGRHKSGKAPKAATNASTVSSGSEAPAVEAKPAAEIKKSEQDAVVTPGRSNNPAFEAPLLGMGPNPSQSFWANMPVVVKAGLAVLVIGVVGGGLFKFSGGQTNRPPAQQQAKSALVAAPMSGIGGWTANWGDPAKMRGRAISLFRPSLQHADYRIEFEAQIESKAFGWVFRAKDPQNYYAYKIETVKPGLQPLVALARITVIAGVESQKHYTLIESPVRPDTVFRVRMDSVGSEFTTRINDQLIEVWQDDRLRFGGVGLFSDPGERAQVRKVQIFEMR